jgi:uncharacterized low-complexity protein
MVRGHGGRCQWCGASSRRCGCRRLWVWHPTFCAQPLGGTDGWRGQARKIPCPSAAALLSAKAESEVGDDKRGPTVSNRGKATGGRCGMGRCWAGLGTRGKAGPWAGLARAAWAARAALAFPFSPLFLFLFYFYFHSMLYLGLLCMYTCIAKPVHILIGSTRGQLGY